jgi:hypothetical protein
MGTTFAGLAIVVVLAAWHLRTRRHPNWRRSRDARFFITLGYPFVGVAAFFLANAVNDTSWNWAIGNVWALVAVTLFVYGFQSLDTPTPERPPDPAPPALKPAVVPRTSARNGSAEPGP